MGESSQPFSEHNHMYTYSEEALGISRSSIFELFYKLAVGTSLSWTTFKGRLIFYTFSTGLERKRQLSNPPISLQYPTSHVQQPELTEEEPKVKAGFRV